MEEETEADSLSGMIHNTPKEAPITSRCSLQALVIVLINVIYSFYIGATGKLIKFN